MRTSDMMRIKLIISPTLLSEFSLHPEWGRVWLEVAPTCSTIKDILCLVWDATGIAVGDAQCKVYSEGFLFFLESSINILRDGDTLTVHSLHEVVQPQGSGTTPTTTPHTPATTLTTPPPPPAPHTLPLPGGTENVPPPTTTPSRNARRKKHLRALRAQGVIPKRKKAARPPSTSHPVDCTPPPQPKPPKAAQNLSIFSGLLPVSADAAPGSIKRKHDDKMTMPVPLKLSSHSNARGSGAVDHPEAAGRSVQTESRLGNKRKCVDEVNQVQRKRVSSPTQEVVESSSEEDSDEDSSDEDSDEDTGKTGVSTGVVSESDDEDDDEDDDDEESVSDESSDKEDIEVDVRDVASDKMVHDEAKGVGDVPGPPSYAALKQVYSRTIISDADFDHLPKLTLPSGIPAPGSVPPLTTGDVIAYRAAELGPAYTPCVSGWRLGEVSELLGARRLTLLPWPNRNVHPLHADYEKYSQNRRQDPQYLATTWSTSRQNEDHTNGLHSFLANSETYDPGTGNFQGDWTFDLKCASLIYRDPTPKNTPPASSAVNPTKSTLEADANSAPLPRSGVSNSNSVSNASEQKVPEITVDLAMLESLCASMEPSKKRKKCAQDSVHEVTQVPDSRGRLNVANGEPVGLHVAQDTVVPTGSMSAPQGAPKRPSFTSSKAWLEVMKQAALKRQSLGEPTTPAGGSDAPATLNGACAQSTTEPKRGVSTPAFLDCTTPSGTVQTNGTAHTNGTGNTVGKSNSGGQTPGLSKARGGKQSALTPVLRMLRAANASPCKEGSTS